MIKKARPLGIELPHMVRAIRRRKKSISYDPRSLVATSKAKLRVYG